jgi:hypothetical protein
VPVATAVAPRPGAWLTDRANASPALTLTGERTLPGNWHENYWFHTA